MYYLSVLIIIYYLIIFFKLLYNKNNFNLKILNKINLYFYILIFIFLYKIIIEIFLYLINIESMLENIYYFKHLNYF